MSHILIAGGGTAGHVVPALAIADVLTAQGHEVSFCGGGTGMEASLVSRAGYPFSRVRIRGFTRRLGVDTLRTLASLPVAAWDAWRLLRRVRPACVVGVGAYASGPVVAEAALLRVPTVAVEMDAHLGWTNRILSHVVDRLCLSFPIPGVSGRTVVHTGRPIRPTLLSATREEGIVRFGLDPGRRTVLVFGGSLGAHTLNQAAVGAFAGSETPFAVLHVTGEREHAAVDAAVKAGGNPLYQVFPYLDDFPLALAAADVVVGRAGGSVAESLARGVPAVLVPYPLATADHQTKNARAIAEAGAAVWVADRDLDAERLAAEVGRLLEPDVHAAMSEAALRLARPGAAFDIAAEVTALAGAAGTGR